MYHSSARESLWGWTEEIWSEGHTEKPVGKQKFRLSAGQSPEGADLYQIMNAAYLVGHAAHKLLSMGTQILNSAV